MQQKDYEDFRNNVLDLVKEKVSIVYKDDKSTITEIDDRLLLQFKSLPEHEVTIKVLKGILGFNEYQNSKEYDVSVFVTNSLHDLGECIKNGLEPWFSPRLGRFVDFKTE